MSDVIEDDFREREARRERWLAWEKRFWDRIEASLGSSPGKGAGRLYNHVWVMIDFLTDDGLVNFGVAPAPAHGETTVRGYSIRGKWDSIEPDVVAKDVLTAVDRIRDDYWFKRTHGD